MSMIDGDQLLYEMQERLEQWQAHQAEDGSTVALSLVIIELSSLIEYVKEQQVDAAVSLADNLIASVKAFRERKRE
jgi:hypothetical protein